MLAFIRKHAFELTLLTLIAVGLLAVCIVIWRSWKEAGVGSKRLYVPTQQTVEVMSIGNQFTPRVLLVRLADGSTALVVEADLKPLPEHP